MINGNEIDDIRANCTEAQVRVYESLCDGTFTDALAAQRALDRYASFVERSNARFLSHFPPHRS